MKEPSGFTIEISSRFEGWWRYNAVLMCGCFDAAGNRIGFESAESHVADVGTKRTVRPADLPADRRLTLATGDCDHLLLYLYIVPHLLPDSNDIADTKPFPLELRIGCDGTPLRSETLAVNQWGGLSLELRIDRPQIAKTIRL